MKTRVIRPTVAETVHLFSEIRQGKIFSAKFIKKDNSVRDINCRVNVMKCRRGGFLKYNAIEMGLLPVFDLQKDEFRIINLKTILTISCGGKTYRFRNLPRRLSQN